MLSPQEHALRICGKYPQAYLIFVLAAPVALYFTCFAQRVADEEGDVCMFRFLSYSRGLSSSTSTYPQYWRRYLWCKSQAVHGVKKGLRNMRHVFINTLVLSMVLT